MKKPKICFIVNDIRWSLGTVARNVQRQLRHKYDFVLCCAREYPSIMEMVEENADCDLFHFCSRFYLYPGTDEKSRQHLAAQGLDAEGWMQKYFGCKVLTAGVYDHLLPEAECNEYHHNCFRWMDAYYVSSRKLWDIYSQSKRWAPPTEICQDGTDLTMFQPKNPAHFANKIAGKNQPLVVGWAGSRWPARHNDLKGINTLIKPAVQELRAEGVPIELLYADAAENWLSHAEMPAFYNALDVYICASAHEGTPQPVVEAVASGVPVVATNVGIVPEILGPLQREFILPERSIPAIKAALRRLATERHLLPQLSAENAEFSRAWGWDEKAKNFERFFDGALGILAKKQSSVYTKGGYHAT